MTKREKILASIVAATFVVIGGIYLIDRVITSFDQRWDEQMVWDDKLVTQQRTRLQGKAADKKLRDWRARSLPEDASHARALYLDWLRKRAVAVELSGLKITPLSGSQEGKVYYRHVFHLAGQGDLRQLTQLLYDFYSVDYLHRISRLSISPVINSKQLDISLTVEAIAVVGAPMRETLDEPPAQRLARSDVAEYVRVIIERNFFSPANRPPQLAAVGSQRGNPGVPLTFKISASDPDGDSLTYRLEGDAPAGLQLDSRSGELRWTPTQLGEFEVAFRVEDGGLPTKSATGAVKLSVVPAPPMPQVEVKPGFDPATQAVISGITESGGQPEIWINVRTQGKILKFREGDTVSVGTIQGKVAKIDVNGKRAEIATTDGGMLVVTLGKSLVET